MSLSEEQVEKVATAAAKRAIGDLFEIFGVDISSPDGRRSFASDMSFLRTARVGSGRFSMAAIIGLAGSIATGVGYVLWHGFKMVMK